MSQMTTTHEVAGLAQAYLDAKIFLNVYLTYMRKTTFEEPPDGFEVALLEVNYALTRQHFTASRIIRDYEKERATHQEETGK